MFNLIAQKVGSVPKAREVWGNTSPDLISQMNRSPRSRGWVFTINNPSLGDEFDICALEVKAQYVTYGRERGAEGTLHWQGYTYFRQPVTMQTVKALIRRAHIEPQRGTIEQAITYCHKDGDVYEHGEKPDQGGAVGQRERWKQLIDMAERGDLIGIRERFPSEYFRHYERLRSLRVRPSVILEGCLEHEWWHGPSGSGKSRTLWAMYPEHYQKELNKWWCGYADQEIVAIEEWAPKNECTASYLKIWADRYPFTAQIKGGSLQRIRPRKIIVLSNYTIEQCFPNAEDRDPIKRRFTVIQFPTMFSTPI